jgi:hypothetical protein
MIQKRRALPNRVNIQAHYRINFYAGGPSFKHDGHVLSYLRIII